MGKKKEKLNDLTYIMNFDAKDIIGEFLKKEVEFDKKGNEKYTKTYKVKDTYEGLTTYKDADGNIIPKGFASLYTCTLPISMDLMELHKSHPDEFTTRQKLNHISKGITNALINVTFDSKIVKEDKTEIKVKDLREKLYTDGFYVDEIKYIEYKRSSSKAREGSTLFIKESLYNHMIEWSRLGLQFTEDEELDVAGLRAYESLTLSGLDITDGANNIVTIKPEQILIIKSFESEFKQMACVTELMDNGGIATSQKMTQFKNDIWDGQCLLDETIFNDAKRKDNGMMLLRNRFFKACAFHTKISHFYRKKKKKIVYDMFGHEHKASDIKLIITESCLKFLKFKKKFPSEEECFNYWLNTIDSGFGICKSEKAGHYDNCNQLSYQMINSMPFTKEDIEKLAQNEVEYIKKMQNDVSAFHEHILLNDNSRTRKFIAALLERNKDIVGTEMYKDFKAQTLASYRKNVQKGKVKIKDTDYCVICSNVFEMLLATLDKNNDFQVEKNQLLHEYQIYCPRFKDGEKVVGFRNPHIATGNVLLATNTYNKKFDSYFNLTDNIVVINAIECQILDRLQGNDMDSDSVMLSINPILLERAEECQKFLTPVNKIEITKKNRKLTAEEKADIDNIIAQNKIGEIVNLSQLYNTMYWDKKSKSESVEELKKIYLQVCELSSLSQLEIDKAKKYFDKDLIDISSYVKKQNKNFGERPKFFQAIQKKKKKKKYIYYACPMDFVYQLIKDIPNAEDVDTVDILTLLTPDKRDVNDKQIEKVKELVGTADTRKKEIHAKNEKTKDEILQIIEDNLAGDVKKIKFGSQTIKGIIQRIFSEKSKDEEISKYKMLLMGTVAEANLDNFLKAFIENDEKLELTTLDYWNNLK